MGFSHLPKIQDNLLFSFVWRREGDPRNTLPAPLAPGESASQYAEAQNFTRFLGTLLCDQAVSLETAFGNEDCVYVPPEHVALEPGKFDASVARPVDVRLPEELREFYPVSRLGLREITDEDLPGLDYEGRGPLHRYAPTAPGEPPVGDRFLVPIYGRWIRVTVTNAGSSPVKFLLAYMRATTW